MKLLTNVTPLLTPLTGIGHYTRQLLLQIMADETLKECKGISMMGAYGHAELEKLLLPTTTESNGSTSNTTSKTKLINIARQVPYARSIKRILEQYRALQAAKKCHDFLYWEPNYTLLPLENPSVLTVYDLSHLHFPQYHPAERVSLLESKLESSLNQAQKIVTISEYTRNDIVQQFGISADKIDIVSPAVCDSFRETYTSEQRANVRKTYSLPESYILSVATLEPRKNIEGLIKAFSDLPEPLRKRFPLVLVGARGWLNEELEKVLTPLLKRGEAYRLGYVSQADLPLIYAQATCMAYVSFFEGYGMPVAEAMASGIPVLTSKTSSMPEVAQSSALLTDPYDRENITSSLLELLEDQDLRLRLSNQGRAIAEEYTWKSSGERLMNTLKQASTA